MLKEHHFAMEVYGGVHFLSKLVYKRLRGWTLKTLLSSHHTHVPEAI